MRRTKEYKIEWQGRLEDQEFSDILFDELRVRNADLNGVVFRNVHFKNSQLGINSNYSDCVYMNCRFFGNYCSLGQSSKYTNCRFENCEFNGMDLFSGQHFHDCRLTGIMKNPILNDKHPKIKNNETVFKNCDLGEMIFDNVNIYGKNVFENCILPNSGIRLFDNTNNKLFERAEKYCGKIETAAKNPSEVIFRNTIRQGQNPIILDLLLLDSFFDTEDSKKIFEEIVLGFELNTKKGHQES